MAHLQAQQGLNLPPLQTPRSMRLLILHPSPSTSSLITADLIEVSLDSRPHYDAISYTWGDPTDQQLIYVNSTAIVIRRNLYDFLVKLRDASSARTLWVDALCISQQDMAEKSAQVAIIGEIFQNAKCVRAWLREHADGSEQLFETQYMDLARHQVSKWTNGAIQAPANHQFLPLWHAFWNRNYWKRTWIVQEIVLAREITLHCGNSSASWQRLVAQQWLSFTEWVEDTFDIEQPSALLALRSVYQGQSSLLPFTASLIQRFANTECSLRQDKVYALLGLQHLVKHHPLRHMRPDYTKPVSEVFLEVAMESVIGPVLTRYDDGLQGEWLRIYKLSIRESLCQAGAGPNCILISTLKSSYWRKHNWKVMEKAFKWRNQDKDWIGNLRRTLQIDDAEYLEAATKLSQGFGSQMYDGGKREYLLDLLCNPMETDEWYFTQALDSPLHGIIKEHVAENTGMVRGIWEKVVPQKKPPPPPTKRAVKKI
jgi:hypothetical protein